MDSQIWSNYQIVESHRALRDAHALSLSIPISFYVEGQGIYHFQSYVVLKIKIKIKTTAQ